MACTGSAGDDQRELAGTGGLDGVATGGHTTTQSSGGSGTGGVVGTGGTASWPGSGGAVVVDATGGITVGGTMTGGDWPTQIDATGGTSSGGWPWGGAQVGSGGALGGGGLAQSGGSVAQSGSAGAAGSAGSPGGGASGSGPATDPDYFGDEVGYVFSSFTNDGQDGLHLIASLDGFEWSAVDDYASVYRQGSPLMRDPSVVYGPDGMFHMVWTTGWEEQNIGIAHSANLVDWEEETLYIWADYAGPGSEQSDGTQWPASSLTTPVPPNAYVYNSWAPEIFFDPGTGEYVIFWSSSIESADVFPQTWNARSDHSNHRIYFTTTRDFETYTPRRFFFAPPDRVVIDAFVVKLGTNDYRMLIKDEATSGYGNLHLCSSTQPLTSWSEIPEDFWSPMSEQPFAGQGTPPDFIRAEGPGAIEIDGTWYLYADYWSNDQTRVWSTSHFETIDVTDALHFPFHLRHGTLFKSPRSVVEALLQ